MTDDRLLTMTDSIAPIILDKLTTLFLLMLIGGGVRKMGILDNLGEKIFKRPAGRYFLAGSYL